MVATAASAAASAVAAQPGNDLGPSAEAAAAVAAAAAAAAAVEVRRSPGRDSDNEDEEEENDGRAGGGTTPSAGEDAFALPLGQVLMRQATLASPGGSQLLSDDGAGDFLCFPGDVLGPAGCRLEDGEELILVG